MSVDTQPTRRDFIKTAGFSAATLAGGAWTKHSVHAQPLTATAPDHKPSSRPNLLFVFSDQQSFDMLGCYGNRQIHTPRTDAFARQGIRFDHCFSNAPVCTPYRGMLMSGKHPLHNGAFENDMALCPSAGPHFGQRLAQQGYRTGYVGKWHLLGGDRQRPVPAGPLRAGFDGPFFTDNCTTEFRAGHCFYYDQDGQKQIYDQWQPYGQTDQAVEFLETSAGQDQPFALFVSWHPPHDHGVKAPPPHPHYNYSHYPPELAEPYRDRPLDLRPGVEDTPPRRQQLRDYYAMCTGIDTAFGRLLDTLDRLDLADDTVVVFTSDHGDMLGSHGCPKPKRPLHDTSSRVPLILRAPDRLGLGRPGDVRQLLVGTLDLMPTLLSLLGCPVTDDLHGRDLTDPIRRRDDDAVASLPMLMISWPVYRGVVTRQWSFSMGPPDQQNRFNTLLFDRAADPQQQRNLVDDPGGRPIADHLRHLTRQWMDRFEDPFVTIPELVQRQPLEHYRQPPGDPSTWSPAIDHYHRRAS